MIVKLIGIELEGVRRFASRSRLAITGRLTAVVGPNEAGKTSLLLATEAISRGQQLQPSYRARADKGAEHFVRADFVLTDSECETLNLPLRQRVQVTKQLGSAERAITFDPDFSVDLTARRDMERAISSHLGALASATSTGEAELDLGLAQRVVQHLNSRDLFSEEEAQDLQNLATSLSQLPDNLVKELDLLQLEQLAAEGISEDGRTALADRLDELIPDFVYFSEAERDLKDAYTINQLPSPQAIPALANLATLADLDLQAVFEAARAGDTGRAQTLLNNANEQLSAELEGWTQHGITVELWCDASSENGQFRILVGSRGGELFRASERSAGLMWFIAMLAFLKGKHGALQQRPVLLVDEAESHLHYDGQADLVNQMQSQDLTAEVIYTTHSAGCLPPDLAKVRIVEPTGEHESEISNRFWSGRDQRISALIMRMGATQFAFTRARSALITEGPSDYLWLPAMFREVDKSFERPEFQILPGLASVASDELAELDKEAGQVAYLVDGDEAGTTLRERLVANGIDPARVIQLKVPSIENFVESTVLIDTVNDIMVSLNRPDRLNSEDLKGPSVGKAIEDWLGARGATQVSKVDIAELAVIRPEVRLVDESSEAVSDVLEAVRTALEIRTVAAES